MEFSDEIGQIAKALSQAQGVFAVAELDGKNPHFKSRYATHSSLIHAAREGLAKNGLAVAQSVQAQDNGVVVTTVLIHASGEWLKQGVRIPVAKPTAQAVAAAATYGKRIGYAAMLALSAGDDDDGNVISTESALASEFGKLTKDMDPQKIGKALDARGAVVFDELSLDDKKDIISKLRSGAESETVKVKT